MNVGVEHNATVEGWEVEREGPAGLLCSRIARRGMEVEMEIGVDDVRHGLFRSLWVVVGCCGFGDGVRRSRLTFVDGYAQQRSTYRTGHRIPRSLPETGRVK